MSLKELPRHLTPAALGYGATAWLFAVTGPFLIYVNAAKQGNLSSAELDSWIFGGYFFSGALTLILTLYYRQPLLAAITIPGGVLVGGALGHLSFQEIVGAYLVTGIFITLLGATGVIQKAMELVPRPITMAMVAGILLPFGMGIISSLKETPVISGAAFLGFVAVSLVERVARIFPPVLGAIVVGLAASAALGEIQWEMSFQIADPILFPPVFSLAASAELVIPLALTVVAVQNAQGLGILQGMGYQPPVNAVTLASGVGSLIVGFFGSQSACIAGPMTGIVTNPMVGPKEARYAAAVVTGTLWLLFGLFAPMATALSELLPLSLVSLLAGLALLEVLWRCFSAAFGDKFRLGALFTLIITLSEIRLFNIGAPFWGLLGGILVSLALERRDFWEK